MCDSVTGGSIVGDIAPYQAFAIGGVGSVRGYGEGAVGSGRSCLVANTQLTFPMVCMYDSMFILILLYKGLNLPIYFHLFSSQHSTCKIPPNLKQFSNCKTML